MDTKGTTEGKGFLGALAKAAKWLDDRLRFFDLQSNRTKNGPIEGLLGNSRHSYQCIVLPALLSAVLVMGVPQVGLRLFLALATSIAVYRLVGWLTRYSIQRGWGVWADLLLQVAVVLAVAGAVWLLGGNTYPDGGGVYRHFFVVFVPITGLAMVIAGFLSPMIWSNARQNSNYTNTMDKTELFCRREQGLPLRWGTLLGSALTVIPGAPLQLLLPAAICALLAQHEFLNATTLVAFLVSYLVLFAAGFDARLNQMWILLESAFFRGGALLVSLIVIALAVARFARVSYVTTVFDTTEGGVIALLLASAYVLFWWYDYWVNRLLAQELLKLLDRNAVGTAQLPYPILPECRKTEVPETGRVLQVHGASRFVVIQPATGDRFFHTYSMDELFRTLAVAGAPGGRAVPSPAQIVERIFDYKCLAGMLFIALAGLAGFWINHGVQQPELEAANQKRPTLQLAQLLFDEERCRDQRPALMVAASGGGTRAALYTASVLEGLAKRGLARDVIMGSGVSGGGAALAYFAGFRPALVSTDDWQQFFDAMKEPFIQDVVNRSLEWRMITSSRLGTLLAESFVRRWRLPEERNEMGEVSDFGLVLNTSLAGQFNCGGAPEDCSKLSLLEAERRFRSRTSSDLSGGRLILTNLAFGENFTPMIEESGGPAGLPVVVDEPTTRLEVAAALNANFPPVFSNAAVDVGGKARYWITDGGTVDNRGIEMLLYALRDALGDANGRARCGTLPKITVVVADASAFSNAYSQNRGVGTVTAAGTQFASQLVAEQLLSIRAMYKKDGHPDYFRLVYLPMPLRLRESGSFGTHWMLQPHIEVQSSGGDSRQLTGEETLQLLRELHGTGQGSKLSANGRAVLGWVRQDKAWRRAALELGLVP